MSSKCQRVARMEELKWQTYYGIWSTIKEAVESMCKATRTKMRQQLEEFEKVVNIQLNILYIIQHYFMCALLTIIIVMIVVSTSPIHKIFLES